MQNKLFTVASVLAAGASLVSAVDRVSSDCLSKSESFGAGDLVSGYAPFDQTSSLANILPVDFSPFSYKLCLDLENDNRLRSFTFTFANPNGSQTYTLPRVGPTGGECVDRTIENRNHIDFARIFKDDIGVYSFTSIPKDSSNIQNFGVVREGYES